MGIKDLFTREIEKLATMIALLTGLLKKGENEKSLELIKSYYEEWLGIDAAGICTMDEAAFIEMVSSRKFKRPYLQALSQTLVHNGEALVIEGEKPDAVSCFKKAIALLKYITAFYKEYSFERESQIKTLLENVHSLQP
jgi:hypothetical protein